MTQELLISANVHKSATIVRKARIHCQVLSLRVDLFQVGVFVFKLSPLFLFDNRLCDVIELSWAVKASDESKFHHWHLNC